MICLGPRKHCIPLQYSVIAASSGWPTKSSGPCTLLAGSTDGETERIHLRRILGHSFIKLSSWLAVCSA
eukprot:10643937-Lingulodinium_polyedra.AAC.1